MLRVLATFLLLAAFGSSPAAGSDSSLSNKAYALVGDQCSRVVAGDLSPTDPTWTVDLGFKQDTLGSDFLAFYTIAAEGSFLAVIVGKEFDCYVSYEGDGAEEFFTNSIRHYRNLGAKLQVVPSEGNELFVFRTKDYNATEHGNITILKSQRGEVVVGQFR